MSSKFAEFLRLRPGGSGTYPTPTFGMFLGGGGGGLVFVRFSGVVPLVIGY